MVVIEVAGVHRCGVVVAAAEADKRDSGGKDEQRFQESFAHGNPCPGVVRFLAKNRNSPAPSIHGHEHDDEDTADAAVFRRKQATITLSVFGDQLARRRIAGWRIIRKLRFGGSEYGRAGQLEQSKPVGSSAL